MSKLAEIIAHNEGFGFPNTAPTIRHNPGDLRHSPHSTHPGGPGHENDIGTIDTDQHGWEDLERQLHIFSIREISIDPETKQECKPRPMTLRDLAFTYAPPADSNPTEAYLDSICKFLQLPQTALVSDALKL